MYEEHGRTAPWCQSGKEDISLIRLETAIDAPIERCFDLDVAQTFEQATPWQRNHPYLPESHHETTAIIFSPVGSEGS
jgi:hypothetical protein